MPSEEIARDLSFRSATAMFEDDINDGDLDEISQIRALVWDDDVRN